MGAMQCSEAPLSAVKEAPSEGGGPTATVIAETGAGGPVPRHKPLEDPPRRLAAVADGSWSLWRLRQTEEEWEHSPCVQQ